MFFLLAEEAAEPTTNIWLWVGIIAVFLVIMFVPQFFTRKKREKQVQSMFDNVKPGAQIKTIGGMICTVVKIIEITPVEKQILVETGEGDSRTTMLFDMQAVYQVLKPVVAEAVEETPAEPAEEIFEEPDKDDVKH